METRQGRRLRRQRTRSSNLLAASFVVIGIALGIALPQSTTVSFVLLALAACCLAVVVARDESIAPYRGLHHAIHLPLRTSVAATLDSFGSRTVGTVRAVFHHPQPAAAVVEPDDEAEAWWGAPPELTTAASAAPDPA